MPCHLEPSLTKPPFTSFYFFQFPLALIVRTFRILLRNGQSTVGGPKWTKMALFRPNGPKWTILVFFGLANAKIQFGIRSFWPKWSFGAIWTILVQHTFRQYRGHSLFTFVLFFCCFPVFCTMPVVDLHGPHILWIEHEEIWDDWLCQGWLWVQPIEGGDHRMQ